MREGWEYRALTEIANVSTGKWDANHANENGKYRFYTCAYDFLYSHTKRFSGECLILPGNGVNVGEVFYFDGEFDAYQRTYVLSDIKISPKYLYYHMLIHWKELGAKKQYGAATNFIKIGNFKDYDVQYPSLPEEQKRIVAILDRAFEAIDKALANAEQNLQNAKELFESYLQGVFENKGDDWEEKPLKEVCEINPKKSEVNNLPANHLVSFLPMEDLGVRQNQINSITTKLLSEVKGSYTYFRNNDVLLAKVTPCFENGKLGIAKELKNEIGFGSSEYIVFRPQNNILSEYLFYILSSSKFRNKGKKLMFGAVGLKRLSKDYVQNFAAPVPSLDEQLQIVKCLSSLSAETQKLESIYKKKTEGLEDLKKSILQKAFAGELL